MWEGHRIDKRLLEDSNKNIPQDSGNREKVRMSTPTTGQFCTNYVLSGFLPTWKDTLIHLAGSQASFLLARGYHSTLTIKLFTIKEEVPCPKGNQNTATRQKGRICWAWKQPTPQQSTDTSGNRSCHMLILCSCWRLPAVKPNTTEGIVASLQSIFIQNGHLAVCTCQGPRLFLLLLHLYLPLFEQRLYEYSKVVVRIQINT